MKKTILFWALTVSALAVLGSCGGGGGGGTGNGTPPANNQLTWTKANANVPASALHGGSFKSVVYGNNVWVATGADFTSWSTDAANWTSTMFMPPPYTLGRVTFGNNKFVAVADYYFLKSTDGKTWMSQNCIWNNQTGSGSQGAQSLADIIYANGQYVAVDNRYLTNDVVMVFTSSDGSTWAQHVAGAYAQPTAITYGNGTYVIVGCGSLVLTSTDGATWTSRNLGASAGLMGVAYGNNLFVAVGNIGGQIYSSPDGTAWTASTAGANGFIGVTFGNGLFVAIGNYGIIYSSADGKTWTRQTGGVVSGDLAAIAYGNGTFVVVAGSGNIEYAQVSNANSTYSVTYNGNGNTGGTAPSDPISYQKNQMVTVLGNTGNLVKTGYSFVGWNTQANGAGTTYTQSQTFTIGAANVTLYAKWTASPTYTVTYAGNGSTSGSIPNDSTNYVQGQTVTVLGNTGNLVKTGYSFSGWNTLANGSGTTYTQAQTFSMGTANVTLYAKWTANPTYTVTYNSNGATSGSVPIDSNHYFPGQTAAAQGNVGSLQRTGYLFKGWNTQADGSGTAYAPWQTLTMGAANVTLYATWTATYSVTYNSNGATSGTVPIDPNHYQSGEIAAVLGNTGSLVKTGYLFSGWNTQADGSGTTYSQAQTFTIGAANVALYARWSATYTVTYDGNGAISGSAPIDVSSYSQGQTVTVHGNTGSLVKTGYTFSGWNTLADGTGTTYSQAQTFAMGTANVIMYAKWTAILGMAYAANWIGDNISQYTIGLDGVLSAMTPSLVAAGNYPGSITVDPTGKYAYVANAGSNTVSQYTIGVDGALTPMSLAAVATGIQPRSVTVDPTGKYAYVVNEWGATVSQYTVGVDGALTPMSLASVATGTQPRSVTIDPSGKYAYVANYASNTVSQYTLGLDGALMPMTIAMVAAGTQPMAVTIDPSGKYAYVANYSSNTVSQYTLGLDGALMPMSIAIVAAGAQPMAVSVDSLGKYAYVANFNSNNVSQYVIGSNGALTPMNAATVAAGINPISVASESSGKYAYVANFNDNTVSLYTIDQNGALAPMSPATVSTGENPYFIVTKIK